MWVWTMQAPPSKPRSASVAISSELRGTLGLASLGVCPLMASSIITGPAGLWA